MKLLSAVIEGFRVFDHIELNFSDETIIRAMNGNGKSSVIEAIVWCLKETDIRGKKNQNSVLIRNGAKEMNVLLVWQKDDGSTVTIQRFKPEKGKVVELVNGHNAAPGEIEGLFFADAKELLSVILPGFFSSLDPKDAKAILARHADVSMEEVLLTLLPKQREAFGKPKLGMGFDSIEIIRKKAAQNQQEAEDEKKRLEGEIRFAEDTLAKGEPEPFVSKVTDELRAKAATKRQTVTEYDVSLRNKTQILTTLTQQVETIRETYKMVRKGIVPIESIENTCPKCHQSLPHDHVEQVKLETAAENSKIEKQLLEIEEQGKSLAIQIQQLQQAECTEPEHITKMREWLQRFDEGVENERNEKAQYDAKLKTYNDAKANLETRDERIAKQDQLIEQAKAKLDAVKAFRSNYVKVQQKKLDQLFDKVKIILAKANEDGEVMDEFKITWSGKPYQSLSTSEKVRCDIEIGQALAALRENPEVMPLFIDNAEGVQNLFDENFNGQVIAAYVFDSNLIVKSYDETMNDIEAELRQFQALTQKRGA